MTKADKRRREHRARKIRAASRRQFPDAKQIDVQWHGTPLRPIVYIWRTWEDGVYRGQAFRPKETI